MKEMKSEDNLEMPGTRKMPTCRDIGDWMETIAPSGLAESWDNTGWMAGNPDSPAFGALICLNATEERVREAFAAGLNLIISHHPPIFSPVSSVTADTREGRLAGLAWQKGVQIFSSHTNYDSAPGGLADLFAQTLLLEGISAFPGIGGGGIASRGRLGMMNVPCGLKDFLVHLRRCLGVEAARLIGPEPEKIVRIVAQNGSYDEALLPFLRNASMDVLVTGDVKYHDALDLAEARIFTVDVGHFHSEHMFSSSLADRMSKAFPGLDIRMADESDVYTWR
jgi:dinuclear metal center YbgI/SA1388 family protein